MEKDNSSLSVSEEADRIAKLIREALKEASEKHGIVFDIWPSTYKHKRDWKVVIYPQASNLSKVEGSLHSASEEAIKLTGLISAELKQTSDKHGVIFDLWLSTEGSTRGWKILIYSKAFFHNPDLDILDSKSW